MAQRSQLRSRTMSPMPTPSSFEDLADPRSRVLCRTLACVLSVHDSARETFAAVYGPKTASNDIDALLRILYERVRLPGGARKLWQFLAVHGRWSAPESSSYAVARRLSLSAIGEGCTTEERVVSCVPTDTLFSLLLPSEWHLITKCLEGEKTTCLQMRQIAIAIVTNGILVFRLPPQMVWRLIGRPLCDVAR